MDKRVIPYKNETGEDRIWMCVYRDTIEEHEEDWNLTELLVTKDFARQYYSECIKPTDDVYGNADDFLGDFTADDTEDFYEYAKERNAIIDRFDWGNMISEETKKAIVKEVSLLKDVYDAVGIDLNEEKGLFIQIVDYGEGKEYFIELNDIGEDRVYEPCAKYNASSEFGDIDKLMVCIEDYLKGTVKYN